MIYIVGGNGFVGSGIVRECERRGLSYQVVTRSNFEEFRGSSCELLINANGNSKKYMADREPLWEFDASVRSVYQYLTEIHADKYVQLSSCDVYADCSRPDVTAEGVPMDIGRQSTYGFHKYLAELCVQHFAKQWLVFRMGGFVGQGLKKNAVFDILHDGTLWLDEESELQFISTDAAAEVIIDLSLSERTNEVFNLCGDGTVALKDMVKATGSMAVKQPDAPKVRYEVNIDKLKRVHPVEESRAAVFSFLEKELSGRTAGVVQ